MARRRIFLSALGCMLAAALVAESKELPSTDSTTKLTRRGPAPQDYAEIPERRGLKKVEYRSGSLRLKGWLATPSKPNDLQIAVVYLHGGMSLSEEDMRDAKPFLDAGYSVLFPALRGENGNPGDFELMRGEVDDALAAANWLSQSGGASKLKVAIFGHSVGGGTAELTTLQDSEVVLLSGSVGALYPQQVFQHWKFVPFDRNDAEEVRARTFLANVERMKRRHVAYVGEADFGASLLSTYRALFSQAKAPISVHLVPGDHHTSVRPAINAFLQEIRKQAGK